MHILHFSFFLLLNYCVFAGTSCVPVLQKKARESKEVSTDPQHHEDYDFYSTSTTVSDVNRTTSLEDSSTPFSGQMTFNPDRLKNDRLTADRNTEFNCSSQLVLRAEGPFMRTVLSIFRGCDSVARCEIQLMSYLTGAKLTGTFELTRWRHEGRVVYRKMDNNPYKPEDGIFIWFSRGQWHIGLESDMEFDVSYDFDYDKYWQQEKTITDSSFLWSQPLVLPKSKTGNATEDELNEKKIHSLELSHLATYWGRVYSGNQRGNKPPECPEQVSQLGKWFYTQRLTLDKYRYYTNNDPTLKLVKDPSLEIEPISFK